VLWSRKHKIHQPFRYDYNLVTAIIPDPSISRETLKYTIPDNWYCQIIGVTLDVTVGRFFNIDLWIRVERRGRTVWIFPYSKSLNLNYKFYLCWGVSLPNSPIISNHKFNTAPLPDYCFVEGGDLLTIDWENKAIDDILRNGRLYMKQWIIY